MPIHCHADLYFNQGPIRLQHGPVRPLIFFFIHARMSGFIQDLGLAKRRATHLKPEKIRTDKLSYQHEKLCTEALLDVWSKAITEEINTTLKNECMAYYDPTVQVRSC